jgi:hypothetical protein
MKTKPNRSGGIIVAVIVMLSLALVTQAQAFSDGMWRTLSVLNAAPQPTAPGPEADPYLRHAPGGYDYELELPPEP